MADDKAAPDEEMIEQPREAMFSKVGMLVLIGSNLIIGALIFFLVSMMTTSGEDKDTADAEKDAMANGALDAHTYLAVPDLSASVRGIGSETHKVTFKVNIAFDTEAPEEATTHFTTNGREDIIGGEAIALMADYSVDAVRDKTFRTTYENALKERLNKVLGTFKVKAVLYVPGDIR